MEKPVNVKILTAEHEEPAIMIMYQPGEGWEIYYKRPGYPFMFAFGLPAVHSESEVVTLAAVNINRYRNLFD